MSTEICEIGGICVRHKVKQEWVFYGGVFECKTCIPHRFVRCDDEDEANILEKQHHTVTTNHKTLTYTSPVERLEVMPVIKIE